MTAQMFTFNLNKRVVAKRRRIFRDPFFLKASFSACKMAKD